MSKFDLSKFGGRQEHRISSTSGVTEPVWNFGVAPAPPEIRMMAEDRPSLHQVHPHMAGAWDGKSTINHVDAALKVFGGDWKKVEELIQSQPRGTCGGRAGSAASDFIQLVKIASGVNAKFHRTSHAAVYYVARKLHGWVGSGNWRNGGDDGVASGSVPEALKQMGAVRRIEDNDLNWYGEGSDDLACQLVCGMHPEVASLIIKEGSDNLVTEWVPVKSAQELADGIASGGIGIGSDMQGFTMQRDAQGFCKPSGTWSHYHIRTSVGQFPGGRKGFGYWQSWGKGTPGGTLLPGHPGNCFGVDFDVQDRVCRSGHWAVVFGFPLWELDTTPVVPWVFK